MNNNLTTEEKVNNNGQPAKTGAASNVKPAPKSSAQKKREREDFKRKYFDYYDDVKTNIKQDW